MARLQQQRSEQRTHLHEVVSCPVCIARLVYSGLNSIQLFSVFPLVFTECWLYVAGAKIAETTLNLLPNKFSYFRRFAVSVDKQTIPTDVV